MRASASLLALALLLGVVVSCKLSERLGGGDKNTVTVSSLWPDVPPFPDAVKTDLQLPWAARLMMNAMSRGKFSFIAFRTDKSATEVKEFYSGERMKAAGWTADEKGCTGNTEEKNSSTTCLFSRRDGGKEEGLAIVLAQQEKLPETNIFYARIDITK